jgi:hypothetical protein
MRGFVRIPALGLAGLVAACGGAKLDSEQGFTNYRVVHASPNAGVAIVSLNGTVVDNGLAYRQSQPVISVGPLVLDSGAGSLLFTLPTSSLSQALSLEAGTWNTSVLAGLQGATGTDALRVLSVVTPEASLVRDLANLKVVHAAPALPATVDLYVIDVGADIAGLTPTVAGVARYGITGLLLRAAGNSRLVVTQAGTKTVLLDVTESFVGGSYATVVIANNGTNNGGVLEVFKSQF